MMFRKHLTFAVINAAAIIVALILFEAFLVLNKHTVLSPLPEGIRYDYASADPTVWHKPNFSGVAPLTGIHYETNEFGFRGESIDPKKTIFLTLGDSTTYGLNLEVQNAYPSLLENELNSKIRSAERMKVVNTAFPGQGTVMQYFILRCVASVVGEERIKGVSLGFFHNDFSNNVSRIADFRQIRDFDCKDPKDPYIYWSQVQYGNGLSESRKKSKARGWPRISDFLTLKLLKAHYEHWTGKSEAKRQIANKAARQAAFGEFKNSNYTYKPREGREVEWDLIPPDALPRNQAFRITLEMLNKFSEWAAAKRIPFIFIYLPSGEKEIARRQSPAYKKLIFKEICGRPFVSCVDMLQEYWKHLEEIGHQGLPSPKGYYSRANDAGHPGPAASQIIADALARSIQISIYPRNP